MRLLHTSDWHLGRTLNNFRRYDEFEAFLDWLAKTIQNNKIDALIVAGDIFDTTTPSNRAQELYYGFLGKIAGSCCKNVIVTAGNHDSPSLLDAPKVILEALNVHVIGGLPKDPKDEIVLLKDSQGNTQAIVCAVPFLRDRDIRSVTPGETIQDKETKLIDGLHNHYKEVCALAEEKRQQIGDIPIIATGHLFTAGGITNEDDGVKNLYVGSIAYASIARFPECIDYFALGHLHIPQKVGSLDHIRYSGSPIPMSYGEAKQQKKVIQIEFNNAKPKIQEIMVPCFQPLEKISGALEDIKSRIDELKTESCNSWLEVEYTGKEIIPNLQQEIEEAIEGTQIRVSNIKNRPVMEKVLSRIDVNETLDELDEFEVFTRCLDAYEIPDEQRSQMISTYREVIDLINTEDSNKE